jgi:hypothetical protein
MPHILKRISRSGVHYLTHSNSWSQDKKKARAVDRYLDIKSFIGNEYHIHEALGNEFHIIYSYGQSDKQKQNPKFCMYYPRYEIKNKCWIPINRSFSELNNCWNINSALTGALHLYIYWFHKFYKGEENTYQSFQRFNKTLEGNYLVTTCGNKYCINPNHRKFESISSFCLRKTPKATKNGRSKLTEEQVKEIFYNKDLTGIELAKIHNVDKKVIYNIRNRKSWTTITDKL